MTAIACLASLCGGGCATALPDYSDPLPGRKLCADLAKKSDTSSIAYLTTGIIFTIGAAGLVVAGSTMGPDTSAGANWAATNRNSLTVAGGALLVLPATLLLMRSQSASDTSAGAGQAMAQVNDDDRLSTCLDIRATSIKSRDQIATAAQDKLNQVQKQADDFAAQLQHKKERARQAEKSAADAKAAADADPSDPKKQAAAKEAKAIADDAKTQVDIKMQQLKSLKQTFMQLNVE